jgi:plasmid stabilization system protein ParE
VSIDFTPHAVFDIDIAMEYLEVGRTGGGTRFRDDLQHVLARLERLPQSGGPLDPPSTLYPELRVARLSKFKHYAVFYTPTTGGILVVRVLHTSRNADAIFNPDPDPPTPPDS